MQFHKGDTVVLRNGQAHQEVLKTSGTQICTRYRSSDAYEPTWRNADDFRLVSPANSKFKEPAPMTTKLFQVIADPETYGTQLTTSSTGQIVLEMKPGGVVKAFDAKELTEVRPYTVQLDNGHHFTAVKGSVEVGDVIVLPNGDLRAVKKLDTNSGSSVTLEGRKVLTAAL